MKPTSNIKKLVVQKYPNHHEPLDEFFEHMKQLKMAAASHIAFCAPVLPFTMDNLANFPFNSE